MTTLSLSARASELVRALQQSTSWFDALLGRTLDSSVLDAIEELGESLVAPYLVPLVAESERASAQRAAKVVRTLMATVPRVGLAEFDETCRTPPGYTGLDLTPWYSMKPRAVARLASIESGGSALLGVACFHPSGYVRAAAVEKLDAHDTGEELRYLLVRLNDWVAPVADRARVAVMRRIESSRATVWVASLSQLTWLSGTGRRDHGDVVAAVFALLADPANRTALEAGFASGDRTSRRLSHQLARQGATVDLAVLVRQALRDDDPIVRLDALRDARRRLDSGLLLPILESADADGFAPIRHEALLAAVDLSPTVAMLRAKRALLDRNPAMRELGRFTLARLDSAVSVADFYRVAVTRDPNESSLPMALAGLGETGNASDAVLVSRFLEHKRRMVRRAAIRALGRLNPAANAEKFIAALSDKSPRVTHAARDVLQANPSLVDYDVIADAVRSLQYAHGKIDALRVGESLGKWPSLVLWLDAANGAKDAVAREVRVRLERWVALANRRGVAPTPSQVAAIVALLNRTGDVVDAHTRGRIRGLLQPWLDPH